MFLLIQNTIRHSVWLVPPKNLGNIDQATDSHKTQDTTKVNEMSTVLQNVEDEKALEKRSRFIWVGLVMAFLLLQLGINLLAIYLANSQTQDEVVPDYYQKAINWDHRNQPQQNIDTSKTGH